MGSLFTPGPASPEDSLQLLESYVDRWVKRQLKIREAERRFSSAAPDIERQVEEYRGSLLTNKLDAFYVEQQLDTLCSEEQIEAYYDAHPREYLLDRPIVQGRVVRVSENFRQRARLRELLRWINEERKADFMGMVEKNALAFTQTDGWMDYADFLTRLPAARRRSDADIFVGEGVQEIYDGASDEWVYFIVTARREAGDALPLERAREMIVRAILAERRAEVIRHNEDSLYNQWKTES